MTEPTDEVKDYLMENGLTLMDYITNGTTAVVFKAQMKYKDPETDKEGTQLVAVKIIDLDLLEVRIKDKYIPREVQIVNMIRHEFIIKTHKVFEWRNRYVFIVTDLADGGDLMGLLEKGDGLDENAVRKWFKQIVSAVEYLHSIGVAHRDIKADNVLIHSGDMKLCDFGYARLMIDADGTHTKSRSNCGTLEYLSPEAIIPEVPFDALVSDCFSLGVLLYTMITREFPFASGKELRTKEGRIRLKTLIVEEKWSLPENYKDNETLYSLLKQLLHPNPFVRIRSSQILFHPWFKK